MGKYYYIDEEGNKKYYVGKVVKNISENTIDGFLTQTKIIEEKVELTYFPEIQAQDGWNSYFTYIENGEEKIYNGLRSKIKKNPDATYFLLSIQQIEIPLIYHPAVEAKKEYFSYLDDNDKEVRYEGDLDIIKYDKKLKRYYIEKD